MIDHFSIFTKAGLVLWSYSDASAALKGAPVEALIKTVLLEERGGADCRYEIDSYKLHWSFSKKLGLELVFVAVYQNIFNLLYIDDLLTRVRRTFLKRFADELQRPGVPAIDFDAQFTALLTKLQREELEQRKTGSRSPRKGGEPPSASTSGDGGHGDGGDDDGDGEEDGDGEDDGDADAPLSPRDRARLAARRKGKGGGGSGSSSGAKSPPASPTRSPKKPGKEKRRWDDAKLTEEELAELDVASSAAASKEERVKAVRARFMGDDGKEDPAWLLDSDDEGSGDEGEEESKAPASWTSRLTGLFKTITGGKLLTEEDLAPALEEMETLLTTKNVAADIAAKICDSVGSQLVGQKLEAFSSISAIVSKALEAAVSRVLTPKRSIDVVREVEASRAAGKPYSIVFIGVNGVGKSTSLSKVCYYLQQNGFRVMIAGCDTFRAGALEQLEVHAEALKVPLYSQGYSKDAARVAKGGIDMARARGYDVVLIDTAGRMEDNEPLMRSLANLVELNNPDLVLFVGEALVGNKAVEQLTRFNQALIDYSSAPEPRCIDGIVLTKFDTIDDKVGAAISMVYTTGQPIVFVGTGQKYVHLRALNVKTFVRALFS